jgi:hypothetical protein
MIKFAIVPDPIRPDCKPQTMLSGMLERGELPKFSKAWGSTPGGDCHEIAEDLCTDLVRSPSRWSWRWITAQTKFGPHSWLECDGWAVDASNGATRPVLIQRASDYRLNVKATDVQEALLNGVIPELVTKPNPKAQAWPQPRRDVRV